MTVESLSLSFPEFILKHCEFVRLNKSGNVSTRAAGSPPKAETMWDEIKQALKRFAPSEYLHYSKDVIETDMSPTAAENLLHRLKNVLVTRQRDDVSSRVGTAMSSEYFSPECRIPLGKVICLRPVDTDRIVYIYDESRDEAHIYTPSAMEDVLGRLDEDTRKAFKAERVKPVKVSYHPHKPRIFHDGQHTVFNTHTPPAWAKNWVPDYSNSSLPEEIDLIMKHLTPNEADRAVLYGWMRDAVFSRAKRVLILRGDAGCGKNIYCDYIIGSLVGNKAPSVNWYKAQRKFKQSAFHGSLATCRMFVADEMEFDNDAKETFKDYDNGIATLEKKFENASAPVQLHCSMAIIANSKYNITMSFNDRKFYVPTLNTVDMKNVYPEEWLNNVCQVLLTQDDYLTRIANFLHFHVQPTIYPATTPQGLELSWLSLPAWLQKFLTLAVTKRCFDEKEFRRLSPKGTRVELNTLQVKVEEFGNSRNPKGGGAGHFKVSENNWTFFSSIYKRFDLIHMGKHVTHEEGEAASPALSVVEVTSLGAN